jgi:hypothetical protein
MEVPNLKFHLNSNKSTNKSNSFTGLLFDLYVWLNMFREPPRPSSGKYTALGASGFTVGERRLQRWWSWSSRFLPDHDQQRSNRQSTTVKPEAPSTV